MHEGVCAKGLFPDSNRHLSSDVAFKHLQRILPRTFHSQYSPDARWYCTSSVFSFLRDDWVSMMVLLYLLVAYRFDDDIVVTAQLRQKGFWWPSEKQRLQGQKFATKCENPFWFAQWNFVRIHGFSPDSCWISDSGLANKSINHPAPLSKVADCKKLIQFNLGSDGFSPNKFVWINWNIYENPFRFLQFCWRESLREWTPEFLLNFWLWSCQ